MKDSKTKADAQKTATIEKSIDVEVPLTTAYNQWTQFEEFPKFMEGVERVQQLDDRRLHWVAEIGGQKKEWDAVITEQKPDKCVAWTSEAGNENAGRVTFQPVEAGVTRIKLRMAYEPEGFTENVGDKLGFVGRRVEGDLKRFKQFIEDRGIETGGWRGTLSQN